MRPPLFVKLPKAFHTSQQRALHFLFFGLPLAPSPKFLDSRIQEDSWEIRGPDQPDIGFLNESAAAQSYHFFRAVPQLLEQFFQSLMLRAAKSSFPRVTEDFRYPLLFAPFNAVVQILERPAQVLSQNSPYTAFAGAHESDQDYGLRVRQMTGPIRPVVRRISPCNFGRFPGCHSRCFSFLGYLFS